MGASTVHTPSDENALAELIQDAAQAHRALSIEGGGSRRGVGHEVAGTSVSTSALSGITLYEPGALTLVARAGTPLAEIEATLAAEGQMLPFEAPSWAALLGNDADADSTIGGVVATNASGPRRIQAGACRDSLIGVRFVDGAGRVLKNGGRVMKNVTGYDLVKLMCGTHGTLGVLTEVSFKLLPAPQTTVSVQLSGLDAATAVRAMSAALGSPYNVSGAAHSMQRGVAITSLRLEGLTQSVDYRATELVRTLETYGAASVDRDPDSVAHTWRELRDVSAFADQDGRDVWRVSVKPSDGPAVAAALDGADALYDWGGGLVWLAVAAGTDVRAALAHLSGHATLWRASTDTRDRLGVFHPEPQLMAQIGARLRTEFDPAGVLNPGRMGQPAAASAA